MKTSTNQWFRRSILALPLAAQWLICAENATPSGMVDLLVDTEFRRGVEARDRDGAPVAIHWGSGGEGLVWRVAQHHSRSSIAEEAFRTIEKDSFVFRDQWQLLSCNPSGNDADVVLGVNAFKEYEGRFRSRGDPWPHLFLSQRMASYCDRSGQDGLRLADLEGLEFGLRLRLLSDHRQTGTGYDPRIHAAQFVFFLTVRNANEQSPGHGDYYWFGVMLYDDRYPLTSLRVQRDAGTPRKRGTEKLIYDIGLAPFTNAVVASGEWTEVGGELLPHVMAGLEDAWSRGYLSGSRDPGDYELGGLYLGWEITGLNNAAMALKDVSLRARTKPSRQ